MVDPGGAEARYRFADLTLDVGQRQLTRDGVPIPLGRLTYKLLLALVRAAPNVVTHDQLVEQVWNGRSTSPETVTQRVKLLRDALADSADKPRYVGLVRNQGYHLIPPVEVPGADPEVKPDAGGTRRPVARTIGVAAVGALLLLSVLLFRFGTGAEPFAIAVLPLEDLSASPGQEYFADGMTEALIANLAKLQGLSVISRTSMARYRGTTKTIPEIARELDVSAVIEGSAQLEGDRVLITAQLIDGQSDRHLWAERYERPFEDVLKLQGEVAQHIVEQVGVTVSADEAERLSVDRTVDPETYRAYLRGMYHLNRSTPRDVNKGLAYLHEAVARDPGDALAYAGLALGYITSGHGPEPLPDAWPKAAEAAQRAIALDPGLAEAHAALADLKLYVEWDWAGAETAFRRANELSPSLAMNHYHYAWYLALFGRWEEAIAEHRHAQRLDPLTPLHSIWLAGLYLYQDLGRHAEAIEEVERALELQPENPLALLVLGRAQSAGGLHELAIATHERMVALNPVLTWQLGLTYADAGRLDEARGILERMSAEAPTPWTAFGRAMLHAQFGELDQAFEWLEFRPPHAWVPWVRVDPWMRPHLEGDPRLDAWLARMRLPD